MATPNQAAQARAIAGSRAGRWAVAAVFALGATTTALAQEGESQYVIEQLVVSVNAAPDGSGDRVDQIKSGDRVEVIEKQGDQSHVRLSSGQEGWVRTSYLSSAPPMREQLKARTEELEKVRAEKTKLEADLASARKAASAATAAATAASAPSAAAARSGSGPSASATGSSATTSSAPATGPSASASAPAGELAHGRDPAAAADAPGADIASSNPPMFSNDGVMPSRPSWLVAITVSLMTLVAGFALGWRVLDKRIRAKYGGLRIY